MSQYEWAKRLAEAGFHVFPLKPNSKLPAIKDFPNKATRDQEQIEKWWKDPVLGIEKPYNVGISTTRFGENEALLAVDVDNKGKKKGDEEVFKLELEGLEFPPTFEQITPTGGRHLIYRTRNPLPQGVDRLGPGLDIRSRGGYLVGAGSILDGKLYSEIDRRIRDVPGWIASRLSLQVQESKAPPPEVTAAVDRVAAGTRATYYFQHEAELSVEGAGGNETAYRVFCRAKDIGVDSLVCFELAAEYWNPRCSPPWSLDELKKLVENAYRYGTEPIGVIAPETQFEKIEETKEKSYLEKINEQYALVFIEGSHFILQETVDEKGRWHHTFFNEQAFKRKFSTKTVVYNDRPKSYAQVWLDWAGRREYQGVCFAPEREARHNYYNLWGGFTVNPLAPVDATADQRRGLQMFLDHAKENVCLGNEDHFRWLMGYFAHLVQKPYERPLTTLVFRGDKGVGKNALVDRVGNLLGSRHYKVTEDQRYLTSNFNGHLDSCLMLVLDEAFWSGDKSADGKLKGLTTAPEIMIERKGKEPYVVDNLVRLVVIGNEDWLVPASHDERRYAVFHVGTGRKQDRSFFHTMRILLDEKGGARLLLHYLKSFDLSTVDVNAAPSTQALLEQKMNSLDSFEQWWFQCLSDGIIVHSDFAEGWPSAISKEMLRMGFDRYLKLRNIRGWTPSDVSVGKKLRRCCPSVVSRQHRDSSDRNRFVKDYHLPELGQARKEWETYIGHEGNWE